MTHAEQAMLWPWTQQMWAAEAMTTLLSDARSEGCYNSPIAEVLSMLMLLTRYALHGMLLPHAAQLSSMAGELQT